MGIIDAYAESIRRSLSWCRTCRVWVLGRKTLAVRVGRRLFYVRVYGRRWPMPPSLLARVVEDAEEVRERVRARERVVVVVGDRPFFATRGARRLAATLRVKLAYSIALVQAAIVSVVGEGVRWAEELASWVSMAAKRLLPSLKPVSLMGDIGPPMLP